MKSHVPRILQEIGLPDREALVYHYLLTHPAVTAAKLGADTGVSRTNVYNVIRSLEQKRLIVRNGTGAKLLFSAAHPAALETYFDGYQKQAAQTASRLAQTLPALIKEYELGERKTGVFRFEGREGLMRVYSDLLRDSKEICSIMNRGLLRQSLRQYNAEYVRRRARARIKSRVITPADEASVGVRSSDDRELREVRYVDATVFPFQMDVKVTDNCVVLTTFAEESAAGIVIVDSEITRNFRVLFELFWRMAKKEEDEEHEKKE